jgi:competence protein ComEC
MSSAPFPIHSVLTSLRSSFLLFITLAHLLGQACAAQGWFVPSSIWVGVGFVIIGVALVFVDRRCALLMLCFCLTFFIANTALRHVLKPSFSPDHVHQLALPQEVTIEGWLYREPDRFPHRGRLYIETLHVWKNGSAYPAQGKILVSVRSLTGPWQYGDLLRVTVRLRTPRNFHTPGSFDYEGHLARQDIYVTAFLWEDKEIERVGWHGNLLGKQVEHLRRTIGSFFSAHLDEQTAAVLRALIVGDEAHLTKDVRTLFSRAGVAHVLSISGLHISLVAAASYGAWWWLLGRSHYLLLRFVMPKIAALLTIPPVLFYAGLAGSNVATWRSVVMVLVYLLAILLDRQEEVYRSLAFAALLISLLWPGAVLDISFQLSFLSVLSLLLGMQRFSVWWETKKVQRLTPFPLWQERIGYWLAAYFVVSLSAMLGSAPLTAFHFNQVSVVGVLANLLIVPLLGSAAVILGLSAAGLFLLSPTFAIPVLVCAGVATQGGAWLTQMIGGWSFSAFSVVTPTLLELLLLYSSLFCGFFSIAWMELRTASLMRALFFVSLLALLTDCLFWIHSRYFHQDLRVTFLDVGQGDATVVELPGSQVMVIDGGGFASEEFDAGEAILAPFLWSRKIARVDILVMSHPQLDHYGGLAFVAEQFAPRELWFNGERASITRFARLWTALEHAGAALRVFCRDTSRIDLVRVQVEVLHPPCQHTGLDTNNASLVLRLSHSEIDFLFTGDLEAAGEQGVLAHRSEVASEILKAPHHGSRTSSTLAFVNEVNPQVVVASLGDHNRFGFPAAEVVQRYKQKGSRFFRTDQDGAVTIISDGHSYKIATTRERLHNP